MHVRELTDGIYQNFKTAGWKHLWKDCRSYMWRAEELQCTLCQAKRLSWESTNRRWIPVFRRVFQGVEGQERKHLGVCNFVQSINNLKRNIARRQMWVRWQRVRPLGSSKLLLGARGRAVASGGVRTNPGGARQGTRTRWHLHREPFQPKSAVGLGAPWATRWVTW